MKKMGAEKGSARGRQTPFSPNQKVALRITSRIDRGFSAVINGTHKGVLYKNEVFQPLKIGQEVDGYIKKIREDNKIDLCLQKPGYQTVDGLIRKIMNTLQKHGGFLAITDKSRPKEIADLFGVSKKTYKKAVGSLYKKRLISLEKDGIRLRKKM